MSVFKLFSIIVLTISSVLSFLGFEITGILPPYPGSFYPFTLPFLFQINLIVVVSIFVLTKKSLPLYFFNLVSFTLLIGSSSFAMTRWPGGDDGPGLAWSFLIGLGTIGTLMLGVVLIVLSVVLIRKNRFE